jgi:flagellar basal-body rod protein FlgB
MLDIVGQDKTFELLERALDVTAMRHSVIASNIANVDTPGYRARDIAFEEELKIALRQTQRSDMAPGSAGTFTYETELRPTVFEVQDVTPRQDGNTVDMDRELGKLAQVTGAFTELSTMYGMKLGMLKAALQE